MLFQQESSHDPGPNARSASFSTVGPGHSSISLLKIPVGRCFQMLDSLQWSLAVRATRSLRLLGKDLRNKSSARSLNGYRFARLGGVMSSDECDTSVLHDYELELDCNNENQILVRQVAQGIISRERIQLRPMGEVFLHVYSMLMRCT